MDLLVGRRWFIDQQGGNASADIGLGCVVYYCIIALSLKKPSKTYLDSQISFQGDVITFFRI